ncbi:hypothetical protein V501_01022 [Pseudogymnoascus sp. VKM F-4519 (FW-2642)]|nr:hypothetical protein V501_01022 [Pseudogymnoascus sp. VKM F-4519 (FW-2642)]
MATTFHVESHGAVVLHDLALFPLGTIAIFICDSNEHEAQVMDESKLKNMCAHPSFYISFQDQEDCRKQTLTRSQPELSKEQTTHLHLAVQYNEHLAAVQVNISPFEIPSIPGQVFFRCSLRYNWCCDRERSNFSEVWKAVQQTFNIYYGPTWDFSKTDYCRIDAPVQCPSKSTCVEKVESALSSYIQLQDDQNDEKSCLSLTDDTEGSGGDEGKDQNRRSHFNESGHYARNGHNKRSSRDERGDDERTGHNKRSCPNKRVDDRTGHDRGNSCDNDQNDGLTPTDPPDMPVNPPEKPVNSLEKPVNPPVKPVNCPDKPLSVEEMKEMAIENITKTIRRGLSDLGKRHPGQEIGKTSKQLIRPACARDPAIPENCTEWLERHDASFEERLLRLENVHWEPLHLVQEVRAMAWKRAFVAACVHKLVDKLRPEASESLVVTLRPQAPVEGETASASVSTIRRWVFTAAMTNAIVNKLWSNWGPKAALVYEACAIRNFKMSSIRSIPNESLAKIIDGVAHNIEADKEPSSSLCSHIFHPALYISSALHAWKANELGYDKICVILGLHDSSVLYPLQKLQMHVRLSSLETQWLLSKEDSQQSPRWHGLSKEDSQQSPRWHGIRSNTEPAATPADGKIIFMTEAETVDLNVEATTTQSDMEAEIVTASFQLQLFSAGPSSHQPSLDQSNNISYRNAQLSHIIPRDNLQAPQPAPIAGNSQESRPIDMLCQAALRDDINSTKIHNDSSTSEQYRLTEEGIYRMFHARPWDQTTNSANWSNMDSSSYQTWGDSTYFPLQDLDPSTWSSSTHLPSSTRM